MPISFTAFWSAKRCRKGNVYRHVGQVVLKKARSSGPDSTWLDNEIFVPARSGISKSGARFPTRSISILRSFVLILNKTQNVELSDLPVGKEAVDRVLLIYEDLKNRR